MPRRSKQGTRAPSARVLARLRSTAYHEAGHAVAAYCHGIRQDSVTIEPDADSHGQFHHGNPLARLRLDAEDPGPRSRKRLEALVVMSLAGYAAEKRFNPHVHASSGDHDLKQSHELLNRTTGSQEETDDLVSSLNQRAHAFVAQSHVWAAIERSPTA